LQNKIIYNKCTIYNKAKIVLRGSSKKKSAWRPKGIAQIKSTQISSTSWEVAKDTHNLSSRGAIKLRSLGLVQLRATAQPRLSVQYVLHWPSTYHAPPPPPHCWYEGRATSIYTEFWGRIPQDLVMLSHGSHLIIIIIIISNNNDISLLHHPLRKSKLTLFGLSLCLFWVTCRSLGFLELFPNPPFECLWLLVTLSNHAPGHHKTHLIWVNSSLMAPLELSLVFKHLWPPLMRSSLLPDSPENYLLWVDLIRTVPFGLHADSPLELLFRTVSALLCIVHILYIVPSATIIHQLCFAIIWFCTVWFFCSTIFHNCYFNFYLIISIIV
jgi:hypothetical protein